MKTNYNMCEFEMQKIISKSTIVERRPEIVVKRPCVQVCDKAGEISFMALGLLDDAKIR